MKLIAGAAAAVYMSENFDSVDLRQPNLAAGCSNMDLSNKEYPKIEHRSV